MKTILTTVMLLALATATATATATAFAEPIRAAGAVVEPIRVDDCLDVSGQLRRADQGMYEVTANTGWRCSPELLGQGLAKLSINGYPAGQLVMFDASRRFEISAHVPVQPLPIKACVSIEGRGSDGRLQVVAQQCDLIEELFMDLPQPIRLQLRQFPIDDRF